MSETEKEEELKKLWQSGDNAQTTIDFTRLEKLSDDWHAQLRRKARIDVWTQSITAALAVIPVFFYPKLIFASVSVVLLGVWYVRELRGLYKKETGETDYAAVRQSLETKILTMENYFRRTRIVMYLLTPLIFHAAAYGMGYYDKPPTADPEWTSRLIKSIVFSTVLYEILTFAATEIYFKILYAPAFIELENLRRQLDSGE